jgi:hypothetical protein
MIKSLLSTPVGWLFELGISSVSYLILFFINDWLTANLSYGLGVNWLYLPAGLRLFLTLVFGLPGALGITFSSFLLCFYGVFSQDLVACIGVALISGFAPYLARIFVLSNMQLEPDLSNLNLQKMMMCILLFALFSAGLHQSWFSVLGLESAGTIHHFLVMLLGDILGSLLLISIFKYGFDLFRNSRKTTR